MARDPKKENLKPGDNKKSKMPSKAP